jgi:hypothetical protein
METKIEREINLNIKRWKNRRRMAWVSLISMNIFTILILFVVPENRLVILSDVITWFYFAMTSIIGTYMGVTTYAHIKGTGNGQ